MAGRAATAVKTKPKTRTAAKASMRVKKVAPAPVATADSETAVKAPVKRRKPKVESRTRVYWAVFNQSLKRVALFEYDQKVAAEKRAEQLSASLGEDHFIQKQKVTVT